MVRLISEKNVREKGYVYMTRKYYEAYEDRYKTAHAKGVSWSSDKNSPIVLDTIKKYKLNQCSTMLEIGCGEGRDSKAVLDKGYNLVATDISKEAVAYCKKICRHIKIIFRFWTVLMITLKKNMILFIRWQ